METLKRWSILLTLLFSTVAYGAVTDIANSPLGSSLAVKPNLIFILDDSSSMDSEVLLRTNDGALWWDSSVQSFTDVNGAPLFNLNGNPGTDGTHTWYKYVYLFPNGMNGDARINNDAAFAHFAIPPTPAYAFVRSSDYNPMYYNPMINYSSWIPAYINGATKIFSNVVPTAAHSHPVFPLAGAATTFDLTTTFSAASANWTAPNWTFRMYPGMVIPGATIPGIQGSKNGEAFTSISTNYTILTADNHWDVAIPFYPATYFMKDATCTNPWPECAVAPDGSALRQYQITPGNTFPSSRSYTDEMQNFANWFTYDRKRKLMLAGSLGPVVSQVNNIRGGFLRLNNLTPITMLDFSTSTPSTNWQALLGQVYQNPADSGTPTRAALNYAGNQFMTNKNIIQYGCQVNASIVMTDGFAQNVGPATPFYNSALWVGAAPYTTIYPNTLADLAAAYYTLNLRSDLPTGLVPVDTNNTQPNADKNTNLHMVTYALGLGVQGTIFGTGTPQATAPYSNPPAWPNPIVDRNPSAVDDLWHATLNSRGLMFSATDANLSTNFLQQLIGDLLVKAGAGSAVGIVNVNINASTTIAYAASFSGFYGNLMPVNINTTNGRVMTPAVNGWDAQALLDAQTKRNIGSYDGNNGIPFHWAALPSTLKNQLTAESVLNYIRGDKSQEGITYRPRLHLLGDIISAAPVYVARATANFTDTGYSQFVTTLNARTPMIYQGANDGMLHAFNALTGNEVWAYVPSFVYNNLPLFAGKTYSHRFYVDGTPTVSDAQLAGGWRTLLVGGLRAGGNGYYALDITNPSATSDNDIANKVLWEFPNNNTPDRVQENVGLSFGSPVIAKTNAAGWVVLVTSGYNNIDGDGKGHLFVLNATTGALIADIATPSGNPTSPSGLAQVSAFAKNGFNDATIDYVYGGDLNGNVWRFDLSGSNIANWKVTRLASLVDANGNPQPITTAPELLQVSGKRMIFVGTGQLLGISDTTTTQTQTMYGLLDDLTVNPLINPLRSNLKQQVVSGNNVSNEPINYSQFKGWYFDFPIQGERLSVDPVVALGLLVFNTFDPNAVTCSAASFEYVVNPEVGGEIPAALFNGVLASRVGLTSGLASKPIVVELSSTGGIVSLTHNADNSISSLALPTNPASSVARTVAWKEILIN